MELNKEKLHKFADMIEQEKHVNFDNVDNPRDEMTGFNMGMVFHTCGTPACLAGYMCATAVSDGFLPVQDFMNGGTSAYLKAGAWMHDVPVEEYYREGTYYFNLFEPDSRIAGKNWDDITPQDAAKVIRHLADTGEVDWSIIQEEPTTE